MPLALLRYRSPVRVGRIVVPEDVSHTRLPASAGALDWNGPAPKSRLTPVIFTESDGGAALAWVMGASAPTMPSARPATTVRLISFFMGLSPVVLAPRWSNRTVRQDR